MNESKKDLIIGFFIFMLDIVLFYYLWEDNVMLAVALLIVSVFVLLLWTNKEEKFLYITGFLLGPIYDIILVPTGIWTYGNQTIFNVSKIHHQFIENHRFSSVLRNASHF